MLQSRTWLAPLLLLLLPLCALAADPPARVARLNLVEGNVSFATTDQDDWSVALLNRPLTAGDRLWVERGGQAELHVGSTALRLGSETGIEILYLGDEDLRLKLTQGSLSLRVRDYPQDEYIEVDTPNLGFTVRSEGEYRLDVEPRGAATTLHVRNGAGAVYDEDESRPTRQVQSGQRLRYEGDDLRLAESGGVGPRDRFDQWVAQRDAREDMVRSNRYVSRDMTGYEDLDDHGEWQTVEGSAVWFPRLTIIGWAPYHYGRWVWVAPWGWTWVDDAPWGFAPFHYGRWAWYGHRWGWVPGPLVRRPVYAPALVAFVGGASGSVSWGVSLGSGPGVAWFPLGPGEPFRPGYTHDPRYLERINPYRGWQRHDGVFVNQRIPNAIAVIPEHAFRYGQPVRPGHAPRLRDGDLSRLPVREAPPLQPARGERGSWERARAVPPENAFRQPTIGERSRPPRAEFGDPGTHRGGFAEPPPRLANPFPREPQPQPRIETQPGPGVMPPEQRQPRGFAPPLRTLPQNELPAPNNEPRVRRPEMRIPERQPDFRQPEAARPEMRMPERQRELRPPEFHQPEMRRPEPRQPEMRMPDRQPEVRQPEARRPEMRAPENNPQPGPGGGRRFERER